MNIEGLSSRLSLPPNGIQSPSSSESHDTSCRKMRRHQNSEHASVRSSVWSPSFLNWTFMFMLILYALPYVSTMATSSPSSTDLNFDNPYLIAIADKSIKEHTTSTPKRSRRQAADDSGPWEPWQPDQECSKTCGGGVQAERRQCQSPGACKGQETRHVSCNIEPCDNDGSDFRAEQCSEYDDKPLEGKYYTWIPYKSEKECELTCQPKGEQWFYKFADKAKDGTPCNPMSNDICVDGECKPLGCDGKLGSGEKEDKCRVCGGDGSTCKSIEETYDPTNLQPGYSDVVTIPEGATSIQIEERRPTNNYIAIKNASDHFYLNGNYKFDFPGAFKIAGSVFDYQRDNHKEKLESKGPIKEDLIIALVYQDTESKQSPTIKYEYSVPLDDSENYELQAGDWTPCSVTCGEGVQERQLTCVDRKTQQPVAEDLCENSSRPDANRTCETVDCDAEFFLGEWEECTQSCGEHGLQFRVVYCHQVMADGAKVTTSDDKCPGERPPYSQECNRFDCPVWHSGPWSACSKDCGDAMQYRSVSCQSQKSGEEGKVLPSADCPEGENPENTRPCNLGPCEGLRFVTSPWKLCTKCNDTTETRNVTCEDENGRAFPLEKCEEGDEQKPNDTRDCAVPIPCEYQWHASQWSDCSTNCGHGHQSRKIFCAIAENGIIRKMEDSHCKADLKPTDQQNCTNEEECTGTYFVGPWENCTAECDGGSQTRMIKCFDYNFRLDPSACDESEKPDESQECNTHPCDICKTGEFGCCPDNATLAQGPKLEGCSNCSEAEFGCCPDNFTESTGPDFEGCPGVDVEGSGEEVTDAPVNATDSSCNGTEFGCCPDGTTPAEGPDEEGCPEEMCELTSGDGDVVQVPCSNLTALENTTMASGDNTTMANETEPHCSESEFGCCPDWYTPAEGENNAGCPTFEIGACNDTKYGCCPDEATLSRGPNAEGCGDAECSASLFGCCEDRRTIAFGPHFEGCERSSLTCETSTHGCCPDGETTAAGPDGEGCGEDCLLSKFGCCPDGVTVKGKDGEGCGCSTSQFGCCPDGETPAQGPNYVGCPQSCATTRYGCCPDGKTTQRGPNKEGCPCQYQRFGCCPDRKTPAPGPNQQGCDDCRLSQFGCCPDGRTKAQGYRYEGCYPPTRPPTRRPPPPEPQTPGPGPSGVAPSREDVLACASPHNAGRVCGQYQLRWFYNSTHGACTQFWYGGCEGNKNNFQSEDQCRSTCVQPQGIALCYLPQVSGPEACPVTEARWSYNYNSQRCEPFWFRCNGNANNFKQHEECRRSCAVPLRRPTPPRRPVQPQPVPPPQDPRTQQRPDSRPQQPDQQQRPEQQRPEQQRPEQQRPEQQRPREPERERPGRPEQPRPAQPERPRQPEQPSQPAGPTRLPPEACAQPADMGPCEAYFEQWYYDANSQKCLTFVYGGCEGNSNRFPTRDKCEALCSPEAANTQPEGSDRDVCNMPADRGNCNEEQTKWYYDVALGVCTTFRFTGCGGNPNRFDSQQHCEQTCDPGVGKAKGPEICTLKKDPGPCDRYEFKWYFNATEGTCSRFYYGGCGGNHNQFATRDECERHCGTTVDVCVLPPVEGEYCGRSRSSSQRLYYYDPRRRDCLPFNYRGCGGNFNRFESRERCWRMCAYHSTGQLKSQQIRLPDIDEIEDFPVPTKSPSLELVVVTELDEEVHRVERLNKETCTLPRVSGHCHEKLTRWFYDEILSKCIKFVYSGCGGNANNFHNENECELACRTESLGGYEEYEPVVPAQVLTARQPSPTYDPPTSLLPELCKMPKDAGSCFGSDLRWYFDLDSKECTSFMHSGCEGNANRFETFEACQRACGVYRDQDVCEMPYDQGPCLVSVTKWYYDPTVGSCQTFDYGGCDGNGNRFSSKEECEHLCRHEMQIVEDICELPLQVGDCDEASIRYHYNSASSKCEEFSYSGCNGNKNRFQTRSECESRCLRIDSHSSNVCLLRRDAGPCVHPTIMWYYDEEIAECKRFTYGGCRGNGNRFATMVECEANCKGSRLGKIIEGREAICRQPFSKGPCTNDELRYYYDANKARCYSFYYGGCLGNQNRFVTAQECLDVCDGVDPLSGANAITTQEVTTASYQQSSDSSRLTMFFGGFATITCNALGGEGGKSWPGPPLWLKDGQPLQGAEFGPGQSVLIPEVSMSDSGNYTCLYRDGQSVYTHSTILTVKSVPSHSRQMVATLSLTRVVGFIGTDITLRCQLPSPVTWSRLDDTGNALRGPKFSPKKSGSLQIRRLRTTDGGIYVCKRGSFENHIQLNIAQRPLTQSRPSSDVHVISEKNYNSHAVHSHVKLYCRRSNGEPITPAVWFKDGARLEDTQRIGIVEELGELLINEVQIDDRGVYKCAAMNDRGEISEGHKLNVHEEIVSGERCEDSPLFADCMKVYKASLCDHDYYRKFCCATCMQMISGDVSSEFQS